MSNKELLKKECLIIKDERLSKKGLDEMGQLKKQIYFIILMKVLLRLVISFFRLKTKF